MNDDPRQGKPSASKWERLINCPGSWAAEKAYSQEDTESSASRSGSKIHEALALDNADLLEDDEETIFQRLKERRDQVIAKWCTDCGIDQKDITTVTEQRLWYKDEISAQVDVACIDKTAEHALLIDYKTGWSQSTEAFKNHQLRVQAVCLWHNTKSLMHIRGCLAAYRFVERFSEVDYDFKTLLMSERELKFGLWRMQQPHAPRIPGQWCYFCRAKADCRQAVGVFALEPSTYNTKEPDVQAVVARLSPLDLCEINKRRRLAEAVFTAVTNRLRNLSLEELAEVGLKLTPQTRTRYKDINGFFSALIEQGLMQKDEVGQCLDIIVQRVSDIVIPRLMEAGVANKKAALERLKKTVEPFGEKYEIAPRISKIKTTNTKEIEE